MVAYISDVTFANGFERLFGTNEGNRVVLESRSSVLQVDDVFWKHFNENIGNEKAERNICKATI